MPHRRPPRCLSSTPAASAHPPVGEHRRDPVAWARASARTPVTCRCRTAARGGAGSLAGRLLGGALALLLAGCGVPQTIVDEKDTALGACQRERADCERALLTCEELASSRGAELGALRESEAQTRTALEAGSAQMAALRDELAGCLERAQTVGETAATLEGREAELRARLAAELASRDVEIERLRDRLALRMLDRILFDTGSAAIRPEGRAVLDKVGPVLTAGEEYVRVEGHTDDVPIGPALQPRYPTNWELAGARAASVVRWFEDRHGVAPARMEAVGHSYHRPVAPNDGPENRQRNRRVEIVLTAPPAR